MTKKLLLLALIIAASSTSFAELTKKQKKELCKLVEMKSIKSTTTKVYNNRVEEMRIGFIATDFSKLNRANICLRIAVQVEDKNKQGYLIEQMGSYDSFAKRSTVDGYWMLRMNYGDLKRLKITAYAVQHGIYKGDTFVPFEEELKKVKSFDELATHELQPFPNEATLGYTGSYQD